MNNAQIVLKKGKYDSLLRQHPWVFSGAIKEIYGNPKEGDVVSVTGAKGEYFGAGHYQNGSISVRMLTFFKEEINQNFYNNKIKQAIDYRLNIGYSLEGNEFGNAWRMVYGEADGLPGLIIDFYNEVAVIQTHSIGFHLIINQIKDALLENIGNYIKAIYYKPKENIVGSNTSELIFGEIPKPLIINEYNSKFIVNIEEGQKTGFFIDQRENRKILSTFAKNKSVLNMFCYTGGFSVSALNGGANIVHSVDSSSSAIKLAEENIALNGFDVSENKCFVSDAYDFMENNDIFYDIIILDPPAFAKHLDAKHRAVKGYQRLNNIAISKIKKGGFIFTYSCSQVIDKRLFDSTVLSAAILSKRNVRVVQELTHAPCHANSIFHPEGKYLKVFYYTWSNKYYMFLLLSIAIVR